MNMYGSLPESAQRKVQRIYTERIHHVKCNWKSCTNSASLKSEFGKTGMSKVDACKMFEGAGWHFMSHKGWICPECMSTL